MVDKLVIDLSEKLRVELVMEPDYEAPFPGYLGRYDTKPGPNRIDRKLGRLLGDWREHRLAGRLSPHGDWQPVFVDGQEVYFKPGEAAMVERLLELEETSCEVWPRTSEIARVIITARAILVDGLRRTCYDEWRQCRYFVPEYFEDTPDGHRVAIEDWERAEEYNDGEWWYVSPKTVVTLAGAMLVEQYGPWVESDSGDEYFAEVAEECIMGALADTRQVIERILGEGSSAISQIQIFNCKSYLEGAQAGSARLECT